MGTLTSTTKFHEILDFTLMFFFLNLLTNLTWEAEEEAMHGFCMQECMPPRILLEKYLCLNFLIIQK